MNNKFYHHELNEIIKQIGRILATDGKNHPKNWEEIIESDLFKKVQYEEEFLLRFGSMLSEIPVAKPAAKYIYEHYDSKRLKGEYPKDVYRRLQWALLSGYKYASKASDKYVDGAMKAVTLFVNPARGARKDPMAQYYTWKEILAGIIFVIFMCGLLYIFSKLDGFY